MNLLTDKLPATVTVVMDTTLNAEEASTFRAMVREALASSPKELVLDCSVLSYVDSTGLGLLTLARSEAARIGATVKLHNVNNGHTRKVLELVRFDQMFAITYSSQQ
ncbi:MAG: STAS domain-containing protein [Proteobacteria bacterium]|nr:STAS domain-containing protein [Pseudomonadota bacterium]